MPHSAHVMSASTLVVLISDVSRPMISVLEAFLARGKAVEKGEKMNFAISYHSSAKSSGVHGSATLLSEVAAQLHRHLSVGAMDSSEVGFHRAHPRTCCNA